MSRLPKNTKNTDSRNRPAAVVLVAVLFLLIAVACSRPQRHFLVMVDTSGSMSGPGKTIEKVKQSLPQLLNTVRNGDTVTIGSFDERARVGDTIAVRSDADKAKITEAVRILSAQGAFTDMYAMVDVIRERTRDLEKMGGQVFVVILTDGLDDPRPGLRRDRLNLDTLRSKEEPEVREYFVYYVSLGTLRDPKLESRLKTISSQVKVVEGKKGGSPGQETGMDKVSQDITRVSWWSPIQKFLKAHWMEMAAGVGGLLLLLLLIFLIKKIRNRHKVTGKILYYEDGANYPMKSEYSLAKLNSPTFSIGPALGSNLRIKTLGAQQKFNFRAGVAKGENFLVPVGKSSSLIKAVTQKRKGLLVKGDKFKIGNFIFEYTDGTEKAKR